MPLLQIRRIEMVGRDRVERVGEHEYVTVDGVSMRILRLDKVINVSAPEGIPAESASQMSLILPKFGRSGDGDPGVADRGHRIVVGRLAGTSGTGSRHPRLGGRARPADALPGYAPADAEAVRQVVAGPAGGGGSTRRPRRLLLIDDTPFFREVVKRYLVAEGHEVETAVNGEDALDQLAKGREFDLIVSDIEMPIMDGWEFAAKPAAAASRRRCSP